MANPSAFNYVTQLFGNKRPPNDMALDHRQEQNNRTARTAMQALHVFYEAAGEDIEMLLGAERQGKIINHDVLAKLQAGRARYEEVLRGFEYNDEIAQRNLLIAFADAIQDIMICLNRKDH